MECGGSRAMAMIPNDQRKRGCMCVGAFATVFWYGIICCGSFMLNPVNLVPCAQQGLGFHGLGSCLDMIVNSGRMGSPAMRMMISKRSSETMESPDTI
jgi:hypothetical protein